MKDKSRRPGPTGKSCLTCRRRRKKCDQIKPRCERCKKGGFECLGYDCDENDRVSKGPKSDDAYCTNVAGSKNTSISLSSRIDHENISPRIGDLSAILPVAYPFDDPVDSAASSVKSSSSPEPLFSPQLGYCTDSDSSVYSDSTSQSHTASSLRLLQSNPLRRLSPRVINLLVSLPPNVSWVSDDIADMANFFMTRFERMASMSFFKPTYRQVMQIRDTIAWRLQNIASARWAMATCTKLFDSMIEGVPLTDEDLAQILRSIVQIEKLFSKPVHQLTSIEARNQLTGTLELAMFKQRAANEDTYILLRNHAPTFIQIAFSDPSLWPKPCNSTAISLAHIFASSTYELAHYAMVDMMCAMSYGLPQSVEYDTSVPPMDGGMQFAALVHGCPIEMQLIFADLNKLASWNRIGPASDWCKIEKKLKEWQPAMRNPPEDDSWKLVARLAVQESWRHTLLIYMYMAVCGASSDEPRVAKSVRQVFQTFDTVKLQLQPISTAHFFMQLLIAGAFTPYEKHRGLARAKLIHGVMARFWILNIGKFVPVLDHLWHGAAANGRAIRWRDYVSSRQAVIPVETWL